MFWRSMSMPMPATWKLRVEDVFTETVQKARSGSGPKRRGSGAAAAADSDSEEDHEQQ